jgi:hypothetical protein
LAFIRQHARGRLKQDLEKAAASGDITLQYLYYDWTLNR